jgi:transcriptional regulator with XRE-family HTH domain
MSTMEEYKAELQGFLKGFGEKVRRARIEKSEHRSQEKLADATRLHRTEVGKIEQGVVEPRLTTLVILAAGLGVTIDELVSDLPVPEERRPSPHTERWS